MEKIELLYPVVLSDADIHCIFILSPFKHGSMLATDDAKKKHRGILAQMPFVCS